MLHGLVRDEIRALIAAGIPQAEVIAQASWRAREWLGLPGLDEHAPADLVVYEADPRTDLSTVDTPHRMVLRGAARGVTAQPTRRGAVSSLGGWSPVFTVADGSTIRMWHSASARGQCSTPFGTT